MKQILKKMKMTKFVVFSVLLFFSQWTIAQTFDIGLNKYAFNGAVEAIVTDANGNTYVGGSFTAVNLLYGHGVSMDVTTGAANPNFAKVAGGQILAVVSIPGGGWYIGGDFDQVNGESRNNLARINADGSLHPFDPNMNSSVLALALDGSGNLYAGGNFTSVGGSTTRNLLCKFDNTGSLTPFDPNMNGTVSALALDGSGNLYAGGWFTSVGGSTTRNRLCKFDNTGNLTPFDPNMNSRVYALALDGSGNLYAGGSFTSVGGSTTRNRLCKFDNTGNLTGFDPNMNNWVWSLALDGSGNLYAGGAFSAPSSRFAIFSVPTIDWTGTQDTDWNNTNNWSSGVVPTATDDVVIPSVPSGGNFPVVEVNAEVNDITIESDATLDILSGHSLTVNGVLDNEGVVTVESDGALVQIAGSTLAGNGTFNVERTLGTVNPWYIGSPISNAGVGSFGITPSGTNGEQFDPGSTCEPSDVDIAFEGLMELREDADVSMFGDCSHGLWHTKSAGTLENGRGYAAYASGGSTLTFSGTVNNDAILLSGLTSTAGTVNVPSPINTTIGRGWHLVSNPYPSPITINDGELVFNMNLDAQTHRWNSATGQWVSSLGGTFAVGQAFQVRNSSVGSLTGFQVDNNMRVVSAEPFYKSNTANFEEYLSITLNNNEHENVSYIYFKEDATDGYDKMYDVNRLYGLAEVPLVYCPIENNEILAYNALPKLEIDVQKSVPLAIYEGAGGAMTLTFTELSTLQTELQDVTVLLEDTKLDEMIQLTEDMVYEFEVAEGDARERFVVHFYPVAKEIEQEEEEEEIEEEEEVLSINDLQNQVIGLFPNPTESKATLLLDLNHTFTNVQVVSITGKVIHTYNIENGQTNVPIDLLGMSAGVYLVQVKGAQAQTVKKLVKQ